MPTYRLDIAYEGTGFHGYATQPGLRTVQGELEEALFRHIQPVETFVAGRTDKGVHAAGQVVSFTTRDEIERIRVVRSLNRSLGPEIAVYRLDVAPDDFNARFSAIGRTYQYRILNRGAPDPFRASTSWHYEIPLDTVAMDAAVQHLVGEHDFASFCRKAGERSTVRDLSRAKWTRADDMLLFDISASSFCHQMVRSVVALSVEVGRRRLKPDEVPGILAARDRSAGRGAAPASGLTLMTVEY